MNNQKDRSIHTQKHAHALSVVANIGPSPLIWSSVRSVEPYLREHGFWQCCVVSISMGQHTNKTERATHCCSDLLMKGNGSAICFSNAVLDLDLRLVALSAN